MAENIYVKYDVKVFDKFIEKFARKYVDQRTPVSPRTLEDALQSASSVETGFDISQLQKIIRRNTVHVDPAREGEASYSILRDIYRSDLGELLTTYYFEEKLDEGDRYIIPAKVISTRERGDMPGRGIDAIGYRVKPDGTYELLLAEAKVSGQQSNPPDVVDRNSDSIYESQKKYHDNPDELQQRLCEYLKYLGAKDLAIIGFFICQIASNKPVEIMYGCGLVRDYTCVDAARDFGKMQSLASEFDPGRIHFSIFSFTESTIDETVEQFYRKVMELTQ